MANKFTKENFIEKSIERHGNKYDYSKVEYVNTNTNVTIICPKHGEFKQTPNNHLAGKGCKQCANDRNKLTTEEFIEKSKIIHGNKYDYSKTKYVNKRTNVKIICPIHGEFEQLAQNHMLGFGCLMCANDKNRKTNDEFIQQANKVHNNKYDYSKVNYINAQEKIKIICPIHGEFEQRPKDHLHGQGCHKCGIEIIRNKQLKTNEEFIKQASELHDNRYDYSKVEYSGCFEKIQIICKKHGKFIMTPSEHLMGHGCPKCNMSKLEIFIESLLKDNNITYEVQYKPNFLKHNNGQLSLDFYLPNYNTAIECQGEQHFKPIKHFGGTKRLIEQIERDNLKKQLCEKNNVKLLYFSNEKYEDNIITDKDELLKQILS